MEDVEQSSITSDELDSHSTPSLPSPPSLSRRMENPEHISVVVITVALFLCTMVVTFITQLPDTHHPPNPFLYIPYMFSIYVAFFIGVGLSAQLILSSANSNKDSKWIRRKLILIGLGMFSVTFVLRTCMTCPLHLLWIVWVLLLIFTTLAVIIAILLVHE